MMFMGKISKVAVAVSGGVDSAVAALLLTKKSYNVIGVFMKNWDEHDEGSCSISNDLHDAEYVCKHLKIPFKQVNFVKHYWTHVFTYLLEDYRTGYTPNPDIMCNRHIKFNAFIRYCMEELLVDAVATGHYANTSYGPFLEQRNLSPVQLLQPKDTFKDQTFFLSQVEQIYLQRVMFPLADFTKSHVKQIALDHDLARIASKKESTGICFIGKRKFQSFLSDYMFQNPGPMIDLKSGRSIWQHNGLHFWTIGQCCHIEGFTDRYFVSEKLVETNEMLVAPGSDHPALYASMVICSPFHWIRHQCLNNNPFIIMDCHFRFQHTKPIVPCKVFINSTKVIILLKSPLKAIAAGQFAVLYRDNECLGSSRIVLRGPSLFSLGKKHVQHENYLSN